jgi:hypothetical protein
MPFCGEAIKQASQKMACTAAYQDALGKLRRSIGQKVDASLKPDGKGGYQFEIEGSESEPITIRGAWEDQRWYEEYKGPSGNSFDCYIMLTYPMLEYHNLIGKAKKAASDKVVKAQSLHKNGRDLASQGRHAEAVIDFSRAAELLASLKEPVVAQDGTNSTLMAEQVQADLKSSGEEAKKTAKTALVVIRLNMDGKSVSSGSLVRSVRNRVKGWLANHDVRIRPGGLRAKEVTAVLAGDRQMAAKAAAKKGAGLLVVIDLESEFETEEDGIFYAFCQGAFRLIRTADGRELAAADLGPEKKGHPHSKKSAVKGAVENICKGALKNAVSEAVNKIN